MALNKFFLFLLPLVFSYAVQTSIAGAVVSLDSKIVVKTLTIEDFEEQVRELKIAEDPKKVIKLKYGVPELSKRNNSMINLDTPFHIVIDPPLAGDLKVFYNSSQNAIQTELSKGLLMFSKEAIKSDKKVVFPRQRSKGIKLHKQSFIRIDVVISQPEGPVTYTRFFQTQPLASDNNRIYLGTFNDFEHAEWFGEWVLSKNRDVINKYEIKVIERKEDNTLNFRVIADVTGSSTEVAEACTILQKRRLSCLVIN